MPATSTSTNRGQSKRHYLATQDRREQLLQSAGNLVEQRGWSGLTMSGLAKFAGVSRQLVYEHFPDRAALLVKLLRWRLDIFKSQRNIIRDQQGTPQDKANQALELLLNIPPADRWMIRALYSGMEFDGPEFTRLRREIREEMIGNWVHLFEQATGLDRGQSAALAWATIQTLWGFADAIDDERITVEQAQDLVRNLIIGAATQFQAVRNKTASISTE